MASYDEYKKLFREQRFKEAAALAEAASISGVGDSTFWLNQQAIALIRLGRPREAIAIADRALSCNPAGFYSLLIRSDALLQLGDAAAALAGFEEALQYPDAQRRARKGMLDCLIKLHRYEDALTALAGWTEAFQESYPFRIQALGGLGRVDDAIAVCREWLGQSADNRQALWLLCDLEVRRDGVAATLAKYERLAKIPSRPPIYSELCAKLYRASGQVDRALGQYEKLTERTHDPSVLRRKAFALAKSGQEHEALQLFEELLRSDPADRYIHSAYGAAARRAGYLEKAWNFYHDLLALHPEEKSLFGRIRKIGKELENTSLPVATGKEKKP